MQGPAIQFSSENFTGAHPAIMQAIIHADEGNVPSYGNDVYTAAAIDDLKNLFGDNADVYFTFNGTGANNMALAAITQPHQAIFCADCAHLYVNESTAPETFTGCRLYAVKTIHGKIIPEDLERKILTCKGIHFPQAGAVSITQPTECGTMYSLAEINVIKNICSQYHLLLHVDGARYFTAMANSSHTIKEWIQPVDVLSLGGTKNGMLFGEAVLFFNSATTAVHGYTLKRSMQLASKNRFIATQFSALLKDELWLHMARHTHQLALTFSKQIEQLTGITPLHPIEANSVFYVLPEAIQNILKQSCHFYLWDDQQNICRFQFSFNNTMEEIKRVTAHLSTSLLQMHDVKTKT